MTSPVDGTQGGLFEEMPELIVWTNFMSSSAHRRKALIGLQFVVMTLVSNVPMNSRRCPGRRRILDAHGGRTCRRALALGVRQPLPGTK